MRALFQAVRKHWVILLIFASLLAILLTNTVHEEYPDEYDSLSGGRYIMMGRIPYRDWFQHHQPGAYLLGGIIYHFTGQSFVKFRIGLAFAYFTLQLLSFLMIRNRIGKKEGNWFLLFLLISDLAGTYFWAQMLLADSLSTYFLVPPFALVLLRVLKKQAVQLPDIVIISIYTFFCWFTSMTTSLLIIPLVGFSVLSYLFHLPRHSYRNWLRSLFTVALILFIPYALFFSFYIVTGGIKEWYFANVTYNSRYYIYNYPRPYGTPVNPIRYSVVIAETFFNNYIPALSGFAQLPLGDPLQSTLALSGAALLVYLFVTKRYTFILPYLLLLIFTNARSNPQSIRETDYQSLLYAFLTLSTGALLLGHTKQSFDNHEGTPTERLFTGGIFVLLTLFLLFSSLYLGSKWSQKMYPKYMGTAPLIYDRPEVAPILNRVLTNNDYAWVGPFEFKELFYLNTKVPSKYHWFLDHTVHSDKMRTEMLADFNKHSAKIIVFKRDYTPWGGDPKEFNYFFTDYLDKEYIRVFEYNQTRSDYRYTWKTPRTDHFDIDGTFYLRKDIIQELLDRLEQLGYLEKTPITKSK